MPIKKQRVSLCRYLHSMVAERAVSVETLAKNTGIEPATIELILSGEVSPCVDQLIAIANELDMQLTVQQNICFAHRKAAGRIEE